MRGILDKLLYYLTQPKKTNDLWETYTRDDCTIDYRLVNEAEIKRDIESIIRELGVKDGEYAVNGVYLYGSVLHNRKRRFFYFGEPRDLDIFVYMEQTKKELTEKIQAEIQRVLNPRFHLPVNTYIFSHHPLYHKDYTGELIGLSDVYTLYKRNRYV
jgi:hypothetical protein